jgi:carbamoylphosphate synthase small subunit
MSEEEGVAGARERLGPRGRLVGAEGEAGGELVFNTAMSGYQEILTDPSYAGRS